MSKQAISKNLEEIIIAKKRRMVEELIRKDPIFRMEVFKLYDKYSSRHKPKG